MKIIFLALCIFICGILRSQINIINQSLTINSPDIFYMGVENRLQLIAPPRSSYEVTIEGGVSSIYKYSDTQYVVRAGKIESCKVMVRKNGKTIFAKNFQIKSIADVCGSLAGLYNTSISKAKILLNPFLKTISPESFYNVPNQILSFAVLIPQDTDSTLVQAIGYTLNRQQIDLIKQLDHGTTIFFKKIRMSCSSGRITSLPDFWIKLE